MIDEKKIELIEELMRLHPGGTHSIMVDSGNYPGWTLYGEVLQDLCRLARLGLWAEQHAIPALKNANGYFHDNWALDTGDITAALACIPKEYNRMPKVDDFIDDEEAQR